MQLNGAGRANTATIGGLYPVKLLHSRKKLLVHSSLNSEALTTISNNKLIIIAFLILTHSQIVDHLFYFRMSQNEILYSKLINKVLILQFTLSKHSMFFFFLINELKFVYFYPTDNALIRTNNWGQRK